MLLSLKVKPNSRIDQISIDENGLIIVKIKAQPVDGKANEYLIDYLAKIFKVSKIQIDILKGQNSPFKKLEISGNKADLEEILEKIKF